MTSAERLMTLPMLPLWSTALNDIIVYVRLAPPPSEPMCFRHCCKVVGLNSQTGAGTGVTVDVSLAKQRWKNWKRCFRDSALYHEEMGSGPGFSSGNDTAVFRRSRDLPQVVLSWQWDMPDMPLKLCIEPRTNWCTESASTEVQELEGSDETWVKCSNARSFSTKLFGKTLRCMPSCSSFLKTSFCLKNCDSNDLYESKSPWDI